METLSETPLALMDRMYVFESESRFSLVGQASEKKNKVVDFFMFYFRKVSLRGCVVVAG